MQNIENLTKKFDVEISSEIIRNSAQSGCRRAMLIEHGFHTNIEDSSCLRDAESLRRLAKGEADVIDAFFA